MQLGRLVLESNLFLSPLAGYTNLPFRLVVREIGNLSTDQAKWLAAWIEAGSDTTRLVLVAGGGRTPPSLDKATKAHAMYFPMRSRGHVPVRYRAAPAK